MEMSANLQEFERRDKDLAACNLQLECYRVKLTGLQDQLDSANQSNESYKVKSSLNCELCILHCFKLAFNPLELGSLSFTISRLDYLFPQLMVD